MVSILTLVLIFVGVIGVTLSIIGGVLLFKKMKYDKTATATVTDVKCQEGTGKCNITLRFTDESDNEITGSAIVTDKPAKDSKRKIMYDSANPSSFYPSVPPVRAIGGGLFSAGLIILVVCISIGIFRFVRSSAPTAPSPEENLQTPLTPQQDPPSPAERTPEQSSWFSPKQAPEPEIEPPMNPELDSQSRSSKKSYQDPETLRAKQYANQMVQKVAEPTRKSNSW